MLSAIFSPRILSLTPHKTLVKEHATQSTAGPSFTALQFETVMLSTSFALEPWSITEKNSDFVHAIEVTKKILKCKTREPILLPILDLSLYYDFSKD